MSAPILGPKVVVVVGSVDPCECVVQHPASYAVVTTAEHKRGPGLRLGSVAYKRGGWLFIPWFQSSPSRRGWPTPEAALAGRVSNYELVAIVRSGESGNERIIREFRDSL